MVAALTIYLILGLLIGGWPFLAVAVWGDEDERDFMIETLWILPIAIVFWPLFLEE